MKTMRHVYGVSLCASSILTENLTKPIKTLTTRKKRQMKIGRHLPSSLFFLFYLSSVFIVGNSSTSRMACESVSSMHMRSMP